ncbi:hypothetical protein AMS68_002871 [Peltaster fructicola]|uniref:Aquaporin n=1 Tax=Peltaster fructicola TaxID=286661 RepID=A0A6H0XRJ7_9PEZI|nr:hypothetical protein AMS68_002871 [Peltaster fructicola]
MRDEYNILATGSAQQGSSMPRSRVANITFAGRLGGNQEFIADPDSEEAQALLKKQPDAAPLRTLSASFDLRGFYDLDLWRMAFLEGWGSTSTGLTGLPQSVFAQALYAALVNWLGLSIFTLALAPITGGHLSTYGTQSSGISDKADPTITMATFFAGLSTFPRAVLYIVAQSAGAIVGAYWIRLGAGDADYFPVGVIPGCTVDTTLVSPGQLFALEFMFVLAGVFMAFGVGLDPRQAKTYGPAFGPVLVGITLGLSTLCSAILRPGYTGLSFNPARCLGLMTAKDELQYHWVHWVAPLAATILNGIFYYIAPPWAKERSIVKDATVLVRHTFAKRHQSTDHHLGHARPKVQCSICVW